MKQSSRIKSLAQAAASGGPPAAPVAPAAPPPPPAPPAPGSPDVEAPRVLDLDFTGVTVSFEPVPVGNYPCVVDEVTYIPHSKKSGQPYVTFIFKVTDPAQYAGRKFFMNCSLQQDALWKLAQTMDALGKTVPEGHLQLDLDGLAGLPCVVSVSIGSYQGKPKNEVVDVLPAAGTATVGASAPF